MFDFIVNSSNTKHKPCGGTKKSKKKNNINPTFSASKPITCKSKRFSVPHDSYFFPAFLLTEATGNLTVKPLFKKKVSSFYPTLYFSLWLSF